MAKKETHTTFSFSYDELLAQVLEKQTFLNRDQADLAPRGLSPESLAKLDGLLRAFQETISDAVMLAGQTGATTARNDAQAALAIKVRDVTGVASNVLGASSAEYRTFNYGKVANAEAPEFLILAENIADRADDYAEKLSEKGITADFILEIREDITAFQQKIKDANTAKGNRDINTQTRRTAANALYAQLTDLADIAKIYYQDRDEAKYNDYIIYHQSSTAQSRSGSLAAGEAETRELQSIDLNTKIIIKNEGEATLEAYFSQHTDGSPAPEGDAGIFVTIPAHEEGTFIAGENLGFNPNIDAEHFTLRNPSEDKDVIYRARIE